MTVSEQKVEEKEEHHEHEHDEHEARYLLPHFENCEDVERYVIGGFHPVHLGDTFDEGRYRIVHRLGDGGFSTVWLARDETEKKWVALKIVVAEHSSSTGEKSLLVSQVSSTFTSEPQFVAESRRFTIEGPNGHHLCLVLPVLGPCASPLSHGLATRLQPEAVRRAGYLTAKAVAGLHSHGLCHGDVTTNNILFKLQNFDNLEESDIHQLFGPPDTAPLETNTVTEEPTGPEAPRYIVDALDFLKSERGLISMDTELVDFDQSFPISSPPTKMLGTPLEFLAPEVAVGLPPSPASDVWALGCCILRMRSGNGPFDRWDLWSPAHLMSSIALTLGDLPAEWQDVLWDDHGKPTKDPSKGYPFWKWEGERPLKEIVDKIWDQPEGGVVLTDKKWPEHKSWDKDSNIPFPDCVSNLVWKPTAVKNGNVYLSGWNDDTDGMLEAMLKIPENEAALLYDLLSKIFVYDAAKRPTAEEILKHPWFHLDGQLE